MSDERNQGTSAQDGHQTLKAEIDTLSFEDALAQLETIVQQLEQGDVSLDEAIKAYEKGMALKGHCQTRLEEARLKVEQVNLPQKGEASDAGAASPSDGHSDGASDDNTPF